ERRELLLEVRGLARAALREQAPPLRGDLDARDAPVARVGTPVDEALLLESSDGGGDRRGPYAFDGGESAEGQRAIALDRRQRRQLGGRRRRPGLLSQTAGQPRHDHAQAARQRRGDGLGGGGRSRHQFNQLVSLAKYSTRVERKPSRRGMT